MPVTEILNVPLPEAEKAVCLRKLLEAKDAAVRAAVTAEDDVE